MIAKEFVDLSLDLPWKVICRIACVAMIKRMSFEEVTVKALEYGLENTKKTVPVRGSLK